MTRSSVIASLPIAPAHVETDHVVASECGEGPPAECGGRATLTGQKQTFARTSSFGQQDIRSSPPRTSAPTVQANSARDFIDAETVTSQYVRRNVSSLWTRKVNAKRMPKSCNLELDHSLSGTFQTWNINSCSEVVRVSNIPTWTWTNEVEQAVRIEGIGDNILNLKDRDCGLRRIGRGDSQC